MEPQMAGRCRQYAVCSAMKISFILQPSQSQATTCIILLLWYLVHFIIVHNTSLNSSHGGNLTLKLLKLPNSRPQFLTRQISIWSSETKNVECYEINEGSCQNWTSYHNLSGQTVTLHNQQQQFPPLDPLHHYETISTIRGVDVVDHDCYQPSKEQTHCFDVQIALWIREKYVFSISAMHSKPNKSQPIW